MSSSYKSEYPTGHSVDQGIIQHFETFYAVSDTPGDHEKYASFFTEDAVLRMASKKAEGRNAILALRQGMWEAIRARHHVVTKIFPFGVDSAEFMLYGTVAYEFKDGTDGQVPWSARAVLAKQGEAWKMEFYQVYMDTAAMKK